VTDINVMVI